MEQNDYYLNPLLFLILFLGICFTPVTVFPQCAGNDSTLTICNIPSNQTVDLFVNLSGSPVSGGVWDNSANSAISITSAGVVDIWQILQGGVYSFNYTVNSGSCNDVSTFTLIVGGYAGEDNFQADACEDDNAVNLFQFIGSNPNPDLFGTWNDDDNTGALTNNFYDATIQGPGTYNFTYTVPAVGTCPAQSSQVKLTVHPLPNPGLGDVLTICGLDDLPNFTSINLHNHHTGGDPNGFWGDNGTSQIDNTGDQIVNAQEIYTNYGYGRYDFTYAVLPDHPVCSPRNTTVTIEILQEIDLSAVTMEVNSICEDEVGIVDLTVVFNNVPNLPEILHWDYEFDYEITGPINYSGTAQVNLSNPSFSFDIPSDFAPTVGNYTITITNIVVTDDEDAIICNILYNFTANFEVKELPNIDNAQIDIPDICLGEDVTVNITDPSLSSIYDITYTLSGANSFTDTVSADFSDGNHSITLDSSVLSNTGTTVFTITYIIDGICENEASVSDSFEVNPLPDTAIIDVLIDDVCLGEDVQIILQNLVGLTQVEITYELIGANPSPSQTLNLSVSNGTTSFILPGSQFQNLGVMVFELTYITNLITGCGKTAAITEDFEIFPLPPPPTTTGPFEFCKTENVTIGDLSPNGTGFFWFANQSDIVPLNNPTVLSTGTYWLGAVSPQGCVSQKVAVSVVVNVVPPPTLIPGGADFCGADEPTIAALTSNANQSGTEVVFWTNANGDQLDPDDLLVDDAIYYGYVLDMVTDCESVTALEITVSLTDCSSDDPEEEYDFFIPDAFSPNDDGVNDVFRIPDIQFIYPDYEFEIYNRWGKLLFTGDIDKPEWGGTTGSGGKIAPNGVYFYVVYFNKKGVSPKQGRLYLNR